MPKRCQWNLWVLALGASATLACGDAPLPSQLSSLDAGAEGRGVDLPDAASDLSTPIIIEVRDASSNTEDASSVVHNVDATPSAIFRLGAFPAWVSSANHHRDYTFAKEAEATTTYAYARWGLIQPTPGQFVLESAGNGGSKLKSEILEAQRAGISINHVNIEALLPPDLSCQNSACPTASFPHAACLPKGVEGRTRYRNFVATLVEQLDGDGAGDLPGLKEGVKYWRVGVELGKRTWCGTAQEFLTLYEDTYEAIKYSDNGGKLILNGLHGDFIACVSGMSCPGYVKQDHAATLVLLDQVYRGVKAHQVDVLGLHPYATWQAMPARLDAFGNFATRAGLGGKPVWVLEDGQITPPGPHTLIDAQSDAQQVAELIKRFVIAFSRGIEVAHWFDMYWYHPCQDVDCSCAAQIAETQRCTGAIFGSGEPVTCKGRKKPGSPTATHLAAHFCRGSQRAADLGLSGTKNGDFENMALLEFVEETASYAKRPAFFALGELSRRLRMAQRVVPLHEDSDGLYVYLVTGSSKPFWLLWSAQPGAKTHFAVDRALHVSTFPQARGAIAMVSRTVAPQAGLVSLDVGPQPILVE